MDEQQRCEIYRPRWRVGQGNRVLSGSEIVELRIDAYQTSAALKKIIAAKLEAK